MAKVRRVLRYYARLIRYAATAEPTVLHILWHNKIEAFDRTLLMLYYRLLGKRLVFTAHNVNAGRRDSKDTLLNRLTLRSQYKLSIHIFVHTDKMKREVVECFGVRENRVTVIPYGINNAVPNSALTPSQAKQHFGIAGGDKTILFFGQIAPYKGLDYLVDAFETLTAADPDVPADRRRKAQAGPRPVLARRQEPAAAARRSWTRDSRCPLHPGRQGGGLLQGGRCPRPALPRNLSERHPVLRYSFGLPVVASDVGSLRDDVIDGKTGFLSRPQDPEDLARALAAYFGSELFANLETRREEVREFITSRHSWDTVAELTRDVYARLQLGTTGSSETGLSHA